MFVTQPLGVSLLTLFAAIMSTFCSCLTIVINSFWLFHAFLGGAAFDAGIAVECTSAACDCILFRRCCLLQERLQSLLHTMWQQSGRRKSVSQEMALQVPFERCASSLAEGVTLPGPGRGEFRWTWDPFLRVGKRKTMYLGRRLLWWHQPQLLLSIVHAASQGPVL